MKNSKASTHDAVLKHDSSFELSTMHIAYIQDVYSCLVMVLVCNYTTKP